MARALSDDMEAGPHLIDDHHALVEALVRGDLAAVRKVITTHN
jgi:DNA-binding GntR family transcriptional regulator